MFGQANNFKRTVITTRKNIEHTKRPMVSNCHLTFHSENSLPSPNAATPNQAMQETCPYCKWTTCFFVVVVKLCYIFLSFPFKSKKKYSATKEYLCNCCICNYRSENTPSWCLPSKCKWKLFIFSNRRWMRRSTGTKDGSESLNSCLFLLLLYCNYLGHEEGHGWVWFNTTHTEVELQFFVKNLFSHSTFSKHFFANVNVDLEEWVEGNCSRGFTFVRLPLELMWNLYASTDTPGSVMRSH